MHCKVLVYLYIVMLFLKVQKQSSIFSWTCIEDRQCNGSQQDAGYSLCVGYKQALH